MQRNRQNVAAAKRGAVWAQAMSRSAAAIDKNPGGNDLQRQ
jgi:hypothetical protein